MTTSQRDVLAGVVLLIEAVGKPPRSLAYYVMRYEAIRKDLTDYDFNQQVHEVIEGIYDTE